MKISMIIMARVEIAPWAMSYVLFYLTRLSDVYLLPGFVSFGGWLILFVSGTAVGGGNGVALLFIVVIDIIIVFFVVIVVVVVGGDDGDGGGRGPE